MAGRGPAPKDPDKKLGHHPARELEEIPAEARPKRPPALAQTYWREGEEKRYLPATRKWYQTWTHAPQATLFTVTDWQRLQMLAPLVDAYFRAPRTQLMAEIRLNEERLGATVVDRKRLDWKIVDERKREQDRPAKSSRRRPDPRRLTVVKGGRAG